MQRFTRTRVYEEAVQIADARQLRVLAVCWGGFTCHGVAALLVAALLRARLG